LAGTCFHRSAANATQLPIKIRANVALKLPGAMQLMQLPMIGDFPFAYLLNGPQNAGVNPLSCIQAKPSAIIFSLAVIARKVF
jgi:hypothetical protein